MMLKFSNSKITNVEAISNHKGTSYMCVCEFMYMYVLVFLPPGKIFILLSS